MTLHIIPDWQASADTIPEFNDTIHQTQLFLSQGQEVALILVDYLPRLRQLLSRKHIESAKIWSAYDAIQSIRLVDEKPLSLSDFTWPSTAQFVNVDDTVMVMVNGSHFATVWLDKISHARYERIDVFHHGQHIQTLAIDDRGFISQAIVFNDAGQPIQRDYLTPSGMLAVREDCVTGQVTTKQSWTSKTVFKNMRELLAEAVSNHLKQVDDEEMLIIAQSQLSTFLINKIAPKQPVILSYQTKRTNEQLAQQLLLQISSTVDFAVVDTNWQLAKIKDQVTDNFDATIIPTFPTIKLVKPESVSIPIIYWYAPALDDEIFMVIREIMMAHPTAITLIETSEDYARYRDAIIIDSQQARNEHGMVDQDSQQAYQARFQFLSPQSEANQVAYIKNTSVLLDLNNEPNQFLQTIALSCEVPQINRVESIYVAKNENGNVVDTTVGLKVELEQYLFKNSNHQRVREASHRLMSKYNQEMIWIKWQQVFNKIKQNRI